jgi:hypothetical protein
MPKFLRRAESKEISQHHLKIMEQNHANPAGGLKDSPLKNGAIPKKDFHGRVNFHNQNEKSKDQRNGLGIDGVE